MAPSSRPGERRAAGHIPEMVQIIEMNLHLSWQGYIYILILFHMVYSKYLLYSFLVKLDNYVTWVTTVGASTLKSSMNAHMFLLPPWSTKKEREDERGLEMHTIMYISQKRKCHYTLSQYISFQSAFHIRYHPLSWYYSQLYFHWTYYDLTHLQFFHASKVEHSDLTWNSSVVCTHRLYIYVQPVVHTELPTDTHLKWLARITVAYHRGFTYIFSIFRQHTRCTIHKWALQEDRTVGI